VDSYILQQGANYAMAKRLQHWRAVGDRTDGIVVESPFPTSIQHNFSLSIQQHLKKNATLPSRMPPSSQVSTNVAPASSTTSVTKNKLLEAGFGGSKYLYSLVTS
jgi:hypothetical protein